MSLVAAASRGLMNSGPADQVVRIVPLVATVQDLLNRIEALEGATP